MIELKYSEILNLNKDLKKKDQNEAYKILLLANIEAHQSKEIIECSLRLEGINANVDVGDYDNIVQESEKRTGAHAVIIFWELFNLIDGLQFKIELFNKTEIDKIEERIKNEIDFTIKNLKECPLLIINKFSSLLFSSFSIENNHLEKLATRLNKYLDKIEKKNLNIVGIDNVISFLGVKKSYDLRYLYSSKAPYTIEFFKNYCQLIKPLFMAINGKSKKAIIFDCDNTLWKGVLGEEGFNNIEMSSETKDGAIFKEVQSIALSLVSKGILIGLCSKNNANDVDEVLSNHKDMVLRNNHITIKKVNWSDKVSNLIEISKELNIGLDSIVFIDDSDFEINFIKEQLPQVTVLKVPDKLHNYPAMLRENLNFFYRLSNTSEDKSKTKMYKEQRHREDQKSKFSSLNDFLVSLKLKIKIFKNEKSLIPRMSQMTQKTNQFNLTTKRYSETEIENFIKSKNSDVYTFSVDDKFGSSGVTGLCILSNKKDQKIQIDSFLMSCRIIGRNIEYVFIDYIIEQLKIDGFTSLTSKFISTIKNKQVLNFFENCNFDLIDQNDSCKNYFLSLSKYKISEINYIEVVNNEN